MKQFGQLSSLLEQLEQEATLLDNQRGEHHQALFDPKLFRCQSKLLTPYTYEAHETLDKILCEQSSGSLSPDQAEFLSEKLLCQISAIKRELATTALRKSESTGKSFSQRNLNELYQSLAQHQQWEQRLKTLVKNKEQEHLSLIHI